MVTLKNTARSASGYFAYDDLDILDSVLKLRDKRAFLVIPPFDSLRLLWLFDNFFYKREPSVFVLSFGCRP